MGANPIRSKPSKQVGSEIHVQTRKREYGAGWSENTGCVIEPRKGYSCGRKITMQEECMGKPTVLMRWKAEVLATRDKGRLVRHSQRKRRETDRPVLSLQGELTGDHRGLRAGHVFREVTWELERAKLSPPKLPEEKGYWLIKSPGVGEPHRGDTSEPKGTQTRRRWGRVLGSESEKRSDPGRAGGSRSGA